MGQEPCGLVEKGGIRVSAFKCHDGVSESVTLMISYLGMVGKGSFGTVYKAFVGIEAPAHDTSSATHDSDGEGELLAIKQVSVKTRQAQRELDLLKRLNHQNILSLKYYFNTTDQSCEYLNMVFEFIPEDLHTMYRNYISTRRGVPTLFVKVIMYQLLRGLAYIHVMKICHRDIKPMNLLVQSPGHTLKIGDFGSAKELSAGSYNLTYVCSRYYRAPELVFGSSSYSFPIDVWSAGCVLGELLIGRPIFAANTSVDLVCEISKILGTPTREDFTEMNDAFCKYQFPILKKRNLSSVFPNSDPSLISLLTKMLIFSPSKRISAEDALFDDVFKDLLLNAAKQSSLGNKDVPDFTNFSDEEVLHLPRLISLKTFYESVYKNGSSSNVNLNDGNCSSS